MLSTLLALCVGNPPVTSGFPSQRVCIVGLKFFLKQYRDIQCIPLFHDPKQWIMVHTSDWIMIIRQSIYILPVITREMGKLKTHSPTYCILEKQPSDEEIDTNKCWPHALQIISVLTRCVLQGPSFCPHLPVVLPQVTAPCLPSSKRGISRTTQKPLSKLNTFRPGEHFTDVFTLSFKFDGNLYGFKPIKI